MEINKELILKVAKNARLNLSEQEIQEFIPQFKEVLNAFSQLDKLKTENIKPSFQPGEIRNNVREDIIRESLSEEEILKNSKHKKDNYFLGPKAL